VKDKDAAKDYLKKRKKRLDTPAPKIILPKTQYSRKKKEITTYEENAE